MTPYLCWHDFSIGATNVHTSIETCPVMCFNNFPSIHFVGPYPTIIGSLGSRKPIFGPSEGVEILIKKSVLLFDAKPRMLTLSPVHDLGATFAMVRFCGFFVVFVSLAKD